METEKFQSADEVRLDVDDLLERLRPYTHRFMLPASCNTFATHPVASHPVVPRRLAGIRPMSIDQANPPH
jgi:hypothetical protein